jgi:hypothetical protein
MPLPALAIPAALGAAQVVTGLLKGGKAKREAERLKGMRPKLESSEFIDDQLSLAQSELASGMSGAAETAYEEGLSRDISSSLDAILKGGGDINNVAEIFDRSATGRQRLSLMKENLRLNQIQNLVNAQGAAENQRKEMFQFNDWAPWADAAQANAKARQGAENMLWSGLQTVGGAATGFLQGQQAQSDFNNYFSSTSPNSTSPNMQPSTVQRVPNYTGAVASPAANPNFNFIDDNIFQ